LSGELKAEACRSQMSYDAQGKYLIVSPIPNLVLKNVRNTGTTKLSVQTLPRAKGLRHKNFTSSEK